MSTKQKLTIAERRRQLTHPKKQSICVITRCFTDATGGLEDATQVVGAVVKADLAYAVIARDIVDLFPEGEEFPDVLYHKNNRGAEVDNGMIVYNVIRTELTT